MPRDTVPSHADIVRLLRDSGAVRFGTFTLASGATSDVYVDIKRVWTEPKNLQPIARALAQQVGEAARLAGMELGAVPLVVAVALETGRPYAVVRKAAKTHGTQHRIEGEVPPGERVLVVEDVTTSGGSVVETVELLRSAGAVVTDVVTVVDREAGARDRLAALGIRLTALATLGELRSGPA
jgi:orotate phosphoribosyltransferase